MRVRVRVRDGGGLTLVVRMTLAPVPRMRSIRSLVMSASRLRMSSSLATSVTTTCTPMAILVLRRSMSSSAILAPVIVRGMPGQG